VLNKDDMHATPADHGAAVGVLNNTRRPVVQLSAYNFMAPLTEEPCGALNLSMKIAPADRFTSFLFFI